MLCTVISANGNIKRAQKKQRKHQNGITTPINTRLNRSQKEGEKAHAARILEKAVWGMLPKGKLGRQYYRRLYIYSDDKINYMKGKNVELISDDKWIKVEV